VGRKSKREKKRTVTRENQGFILNPHREGEGRGRKKNDFHRNLTPFNKKKRGERMEGGEGEHQMARRTGTQAEFTLLIRSKKLDQGGVPRKKKKKKSTRKARELAKGKAETQTEGRGKKITNGGAGSSWRKKDGKRGGKCAFRN